jgi:hypothetical protein
MLGLGLAFGTGAGAYAGVHTYLNTEGDASEKADAARRSAAGYLVYGGLGMAGALTAASWLPSRAGGRLVGGLAYGVGSAANRYGRGIRLDFERGRRSALKEARADKEILSENALRFRGAMGGIRRVAESKLLVAGAGAAVGAALGAHLDKEDPEQGAKRGALLGGGAGLAISTGLRTSRLWKGLGPVGKAGAIGVLTTAAFGAATVMSRPKYAVMDQAMPEDNGLRSRMEMIGANGDLVFGLHNTR